MPHMREVKTCERCRHFKRRCDLLKPSCSRCIQAGVRCSFDVNGVALSAASSSPASSRHARAGTAVTAASAGAFSSPPLNGELGSAGQNGLISPTASTESPEPHLGAQVDANGMPIDPSADGTNPLRVVRKRKRNCLSCLRCHRLKVKCDKELPCGRCKSSGNGRECYYSYNKGPNGGKFPCPTAPSNGEETKTVLATWQVQHKVRGSSHWRDLMTKVCVLVELHPTQTIAC